MLRRFAVPDAHRAAAEAWLAARSAPPSVQPAVPRDAATVVLVRDSPRGTGEVEVFLLQRRTTMAFAAGMLVFPGGAVDPGDAGDVPWAGPDPAAWATQLGTTAAGARALACAAVRETFEECGVLLAGASGEDVADVAGTAWEADRQALVGGEVTLPELLRRRGLVLRADLLRPWAHWTTPLHEPRRYDTRFLLAVLPTGQVARHVGEESDASGWWPLSDVLAGADEGRAALMPPTRVTLEELAAARTVDALRTTPRVVREVVPVLRRAGDAVVLEADLPDQPVDAAGGRP